MNEFKEDVFDEEKIKKAIKKGKRKSLLMIILVSVSVFVVLNIVSFSVYSHFSQQAFKQWDAYIRLSTPNGYISDTTDTRGFLGGESQYKVSKDMKIKSLVIEQKQYKFGVSPSTSISRGMGGSTGATGEDWQFTYKENGWRDLMFFHPNVPYKEYKQDEELINQIEGDKIYEVALSFDKPYKQSELPLFELPAMSWFWVDTYSNNQLKKMQQEAKENDWSSTFISENDALGFSTNFPIFSSVKLDQEYKGFLTLLETSVSEEHNKVYEMMKDTSIDNAEILGIVIYGTKDEIASMIDKPFIKASSLGGIIDNY